MKFVILFARLLVLLQNTLLYVSYELKCQDYQAMTYWPVTTSDGILFAVIINVTPCHFHRIPFHKIMWSISSTMSKLTHSWIFKKIYEFPHQESFKRGLCPVGTISWPDKHNNSTQWVEYNRNVNITQYIRVQPYTTYSEQPSMNEDYNWRFRPAHWFRPLSHHAWFYKSFFICQLLPFNN